MKFLNLLLTLILINPALAIDLDSKVTQVTIYQYQAAVTRKAEANIPAGKTQLVFTNLSSQLIPNSIQVKGKGDFLIINTSYQSNFLSDENLSPKIQSLKDQIKKTEQDIAMIETELSALESEKTFLTANQSIKGTDQNLTVSELKAMADYYRGRVQQIGQRVYKLSMDNNELNNQLRKQKQQLGEEQSQQQQTTGEVVVEVSSKKSQSVQLELVYLVGGARWSPSYDLRAMDSSEDLVLQYKANVFQSTGEDWENVSLTLSTGNPSYGGNIPNLYPWYLDFVQPRPMYRRAKGDAAMMMSAPQEELAEVVMEDVVAGGMGDFTTVNESLVSKEYAIGVPVSILSKSKPVTVSIREEKVTSSFVYQTAPKLAEKVFLVAKVSNWGELDLLPGEMNVYFNGAFINKTRIQPQNEDKEMVFSLGMDPSIKVERKELKDVTDDQVIGSKRRKYFKYEISVLNNKAKAIQLEILDQIPLTKNDEIDVETTELSGGSLNQNTGELKWVMNLQSKESRKVTLTYSVKYPKDKPVSNL